MALIRWDPTQTFDEWQRFFDDWLGAQHRMTALATPVTDIFSETDKDLKIEVHLPNFKKDDIDVDIHEGVLEIRAEHQEREEDKAKRKYVMRESAASYYRRIGLPKNVDAGKIKADFDNGVLKVVVPFKELPKPQKIAIGENIGSKSPVRTNKK